MDRLRHPRIRQAVLPTEWRSYLTAHFCKSLLWHTNTLLFAFFLTETCALSPTVMGAALGVSLLVSASADLLIGRIRDRPVMTLAAAMRDQSHGAVFASLFFVLFAATPFVEPTMRLILVPIALLGFRLCYSLFDVPQNVIVAMIAPDPDARTHLLAARNVASGLATLAVSAVAAPILVAAGPKAPAQYLAWAIGVAFAASLSAQWLYHRPTDVRVTPVFPAGEQRHITPRFVILLTIAGTMIFAGTIFRSMEPYAAAYAGTGVGIMIWASLGAIAGQPLWVLALKALSPQCCCIIAAGAAGIAAMVLLGPSRTHPVGVGLMGFGFGIASGGLWLMLWAGTMHHATAGHPARRIGALTATSKAAQAAAAFVLGYTLNSSAYHHTLSDRLSLPSLMMAGALVALAVACVGLALSQSGRKALHEQALYQR